ncbi:MAG: RNA methyltransferase [Methylobacillus sp.]|jgi:TrmH family RNA methyltransferase|nr:RNA methyltransferase [Methylobacillus sp.]
MKNIISRDNPTYKQLKKLGESARERRKSGRALLDGVHLIETFLATGRQPELLVVSETGLGHPECALLLKSVPTSLVVVVPDVLFKELSPVETPVGLLAEIAIPSPAIPENPQFCVLLDDLQDPGNVGTIIRTAAAAGCDALFLSPGCADAWSPRVLRAGMGGHFALTICESADLVAIAKNFSGKIYAMEAAAARGLYQNQLNGQLGFAIGNEGAGLSDALMQACEVIAIPMPGKMESLNAATAAAVCLFEAVRQREGG